jgi:AcrR family transcriptional regulator
MNSVDLREQLLDAAISEFAEFGLSGARVDRIAKRAKANKQLIYYYFGDKNGLFDAAVAKMTVRFQAVRSSLPVALADRPAAYFVGASKDTDLIRLLQWEALSAGEGPIVEEGSRAKHMRDGVTTLRSDQKSESAGTDLDAAQLFLSLQALAAHPFAFPQMTRMITGHNPSDPKFLKERETFLRRLGRKIFSPR